MKKLYAAFICLLLIGSVQATEVAVVDFERALWSSKIGQPIVEDLQMQETTIEGAAKDFQQKLAAMKEEADRNALTMSAEDKQKSQTAFNYARDNYSKQLQRMRQALAQDKQKALRSLLPQGEAALKALIEAQGLDLVLNRQVSIYAGANVDITNELVKQINKDN
ncbi:OmpH/Skp family outer membrane protein [Marinomonas epiphytica]